MAERPAIPADLKRKVLIEAGHRCAIPTCRHPKTELAHIEPWAKVKKHRFDNLIALCPNCHTRYDNGEIDRKSMRHYKAALSILSGRYSEFELRVLEYFALNPEKQIQPIVLSGDRGIDLMYLLRDGVIENFPQGPNILLGGVPAKAAFRLTDRGREFVQRWVEANDIA